jgi:nucleoside-diphosphate-sugar epimerase
MKVLVFGGTGWVGHEIAKSFAGAGYDVTICSRGTKGRHEDKVADIPTIHADKNDPAQVAEIFKNHSFEIVTDSVPTEASMDNIKNSATNLKHYIHCSSTGGYTPLLNIPGDETMPYEGAHGSGWAKKKVIDERVMEWHQKDGFPGTVIRPSYIAGSGCLPIDNLGGRRKDFIADLLAEKELELPDNGKSLLHPVLVRDLGRSFRLAVEHPQSIGEIYNICLKKAVTLTRYIELNAEAVGRKAHIKYVPVENLLAKYGDSIHPTGLRFLNDHMCFDISKAEEQLGFKPSLTVEEVIEENAKWVLDQL